METRLSDLVYISEWGDHPYQASLEAAARKLGLSVDKVTPAKFRPNLKRKSKKRLHIHLMPGAHANFGMWVNLRFTVKIILAKVLGYNIIWTPHDLFPHNVRQGTVKAAYYGASRSFLTWIADLVHFHSEEEKKLYLRREKGGRVLPAPLFTVHENLPPGAEAKKRLGIPERDFCILVYGWWRRNKGIVELCKALRGLERNGVWLVLAGQCSSEQGLRKEILELASKSPNILLREGYASSENELEYFAAADLVALPYDSSVMSSGVLVLASAFKKPCLVPRGSPFSGCLKENAITYEREKGIGSGLREAIQRKAELISIGEKARESLQSFSWEDLARALYY